MNHISLISDEKSSVVFGRNLEILDTVNNAGYEIQTLISWKLEYTNCSVSTIRYTTLFKPLFWLHFDGENPVKIINCSSCCCRIKKEIVTVKHITWYVWTRAHEVSHAHSSELGKVTVKIVLVKYKTAEYWVYTRLQFLQSIWMNWKWKKYNY